MDLQQLLRIHIADVFLLGQVLIFEFPFIYIITLLALLRIEKILKSIRTTIMWGKILHPPLSNIIYG